MPSVVGFIPPLNIIRPSMFDEYTDGRIYRFEYGKDVKKSAKAINSLRAQVSNHAKKHGLKYTCAKRSDGVYIQFLQD